ncbi:dihydropyrimidinase [bacterium]|nr:dihydropyrimidinase [bacterium]
MPVIKNAKIVNSWGIQLADILIQNGRIAAIGQGFQDPHCIDAKGQLVTPGGVDAHVHLQYHVSGCDTCDDFASGTASAAQGGTTTVIDFIEAEPQESLLAAFMRRRSHADRNAYIDYGLHMSILPGDMDKLNQIPDVIKAGCPTFKHYMAYGFTLSDGQLYRSFKEIGRNGGLALVHAENWDMIRCLTEDLVNAGRTQAAYHMYSRPAYLEGQAVTRALDAAYLANCAIYICHLTCEEGVSALQKARARGQQAWGETCTHYCYLNNSAFQSLGMLAICSPPLRPEEQRKAVARSLRQGLLHTVSTDHCPFTKAEKLAHDIFCAAPGGLTGIEGRMMLMHRLPGLTLERWVEVCCTAPAKLMGLTRKGVIAPGYDADIVIWQNKPTTITAEALHERADWSPYEGMSVAIQPAYVMCRGQLLVSNGQWVGNPGMGRFVERTLDPEYVVDIPQQAAAPAAPVNPSPEELAASAAVPAYAATPAPAPSPAVDNSAAQQALHHVLVGLSWDEAQHNFMSRLLSKMGSSEAAAPMDLDLAVLFLGSDGHPIAADMRDCCLSFHNLSLFGCAEHSGNNTTGSKSGYAERTIIDLDRLPSRVYTAIVLVNINEGQKRKQDFSMAGNAFVDIVDISTTKTVMRHKLNTYKGQTSLLALQLSRNADGNGWSCAQLGRPQEAARTLESMVELFR